MLLGKVKAALRWLSPGTVSGNAMLPLDKEIGPGRTVRDVLLEKHPEAQPLCPEAIISREAAQSVSKPFHPALFERITGDLVRTTALRTEGAAGPFGLDAAQWHRLCTSFR